MAGNKYAEETRELILTRALELFMRNGYDNTSIRDICDHLGGMTKGAIYHHFKSKEDILLAVAERSFQGMVESMGAIRNNPHLNGLEKLRAMFSASLHNPMLPEVFSINANMLKNSKMLALEIYDVINDTAPNYVLPVLEEGIRDGSIQTDYPAELAEMLLLLSNIWLNPMIVPGDGKAIYRRLLLMQQMCANMGLNIFDEDMMAAYAKHVSFYNNGNKPPV